MTTYVLLLRGINVGGHRKLLMKDLKLLLTEIGFLNISTYIQSGNVVFQLDKIVKIENLEAKVADEISKKYGYEVPIIILTSESLNGIVDANPFASKSATEDLHFTFLKTQPSIQNIEKVNEVDVLPDRFTIAKKVVYIKCNLKYSKTKLSNGFLEKKMGVECTTRNYKTTMKLIEMAANLA